MSARYEEKQFKEARDRSTTLINLSYDKGNNQRQPYNNIHTTIGDVQ